MTEEASCIELNTNVMFITLCEILISLFKRLGYLACVLRDRYAYKELHRRK